MPQPKGQSVSITLPDLDFELDVDLLPLQLNVDSEPPVLTLSWEFTLAFGTRSSSNTSELIFFVFLLKNALFFAYFRF